MSNINVNNTITVKGVLSIRCGSLDSDGKITMSVEDVGGVELDCVLTEFNEREVVLSVRHDADYSTFVNK